MERAKSMSDLYTCLTNLINRYVDREGLLIDVGAYHGDFTKEMLKTGKFNQAILFEPNPENLKKLNDSFVNSKNINIVPNAVGDRNSLKWFNYDTKDLATGSILPYKTQPAFSSSIEVKQVKLDDVITAQKVNLIKIDTQGNDLNVIAGGLRTIITHYPILVVELIFIELYKRQGNYAELIEYLNHHGFIMAGIFNEHYTKEGLLAFADAVFTPKNFQENAVTTNFFAKPDVSSLLIENTSLRGICDERLILINRLHDEFKMRRRAGILKRTFSRFKN